jgi:hypothetical protein
MAEEAEQTAHMETLLSRLHLKINEEEKAAQEATLSDGIDTEMVDNTTEETASGCKTMVVRPGKSLYLQTES